MGDLFQKAEAYLKKNEPRFTEKEKDQFRKDLIDYLKNFRTNSRTITDNIYDFFVSIGIYQEVRHTTFLEYLVEKYPVSDYPTILEVGSGRMCPLSRSLTDKGYKVTSMDPVIRLTTQEAKQLKIASIFKKPFTCDEFSKGKTGTDITKYRLIIGHEPCEGTEHIIRQALKYEKPFEVFLCYAPHNMLDGTKSTSAEEWMKKLLAIDECLSITNYKGHFIITNTIQNNMENSDGMN